MLSWAVCAGLDSKIQQTKLKSILQNTPTWTDVDAPDDGEDDEGAIAGTVLSTEQ